MKFKYEFEAVQAVYHERPRSVPYWPFRSCAYILWNFAIDNEKLPYRQIAISWKNAEMLLKTFCKLIGTVAIDFWLQLLQLIADCKLIATIADSKLSLQPAETMIKMGICYELAISYQLQQLQQLQPAIICNSSNQLANSFEQRFSILPADY